MITDPDDLSTGAASPSASPTASTCEPYRELITRWVDDGRTAMSIWQELVERHGFVARYATVGRFVRKLQGSRPPEARVVIETRPGEEAQVDYGEGPMVRHPTTAKYRRTRLFLFTLAHSRKSVRLLTWKSSAKTWAQLHEHAIPIRAAKGAECGTRLWYPSLGRTPPHIALRLLLVTHVRRHVSMPPSRHQFCPPLEEG